MVELVNSRWMHVAMAMAALTTGCAAGEAGADEIDADEAEAVEVEETSQALFGDRDCGNSWNNRPGWGWPGGGGFNNFPGGWGSKPPCGLNPWGGNSWKPCGNSFNYGNPYNYGYPTSGYGPYNGYGPYSGNGLFNGYGAGSFTPSYGCNRY
ncbi:hypothetical protein [Sorangium sp. So ce1099]|uniref:hypothetical protein n=1 Tax=Sorangium sp. So ce1099 TaxID=3133331 RepID=UPI003F605123